MHPSGTTREDTHGMRRGGEALKDGNHPPINRKEAVRLRENNNSVMCICMRIINRIDLGVYDSVERRSFVICLFDFPGRQRPRRGRRSYPTTRERAGPGAVLVTSVLVRVGPEL
jgi:hypothetical protein